jgi:hypothetical protein
MFESNGNGNIIDGEVTHVSDMSQEEAKKNVLEFIQQMANLKAEASQHKPVLKTLEELGVTVETRDLEVNGEKKKCLIIPVGDLLIKEYEKITGFNASGYMGSTIKRPAERFDFNAIRDGGAI